MKDASDYTAIGLALVAIPSGKKGPVMAGWNKAENVIANPERARRLEGNIGIAHAYNSPPTMALDIDDLEKASIWLANRGVDLLTLLQDADAVQIISGRPGRAKLLYRLPVGVGPIESRTIKETIIEDGASRQKTILEFRCATKDGLTAQDVLPPSVHPDTNQQYRWGGQGNWRSIPTIPNELLVVWLGEVDDRKSRKQQSRWLAVTHHVEDTPRQRAIVSEMLRHVSADCCYEVYRDMVWAILSLGWSDCETLAEQWCRTAPHRFEDTSFNAVVTSYEGARSPTIGTIYHYARAGGWNG